jgi:hypothetical protein
MHDSPLDHDNLPQPAIDQAIEQLDQRIVHALEASPQPHIAADFASRVASQLPPKRPESLTPTHYGRWAMLIGTVVTLAILLVLALHSAGHTAGHPTFGLVESCLFAQFIALAVWLSVWRQSLR